MIDPERRHASDVSAGPGENHLPSNEFLAALSHEIRNPLAPLLSACELLRSLCTDPRQRFAIDTIERQVLELTHLMDNLVDAAQLRRGELNLAMQHIDAAALATQAVEAVKPKMDARRQNLYVTLPSQPVQMRCDPRRLLQVIQTLLDNAHRYTPERGSIALSVSDQASQLCIEVSDDGYGMEPELLLRIFNLFAPLDERLRRTTSGLGVGLAIARNLVELHGGSIAATSEGPGHGSRFTVRLPIENAQVERPEAEHVALSGPPVAAPLRRILVVEDNDDVAKGLAGGLTECGYTVTIAASAESAIRLATESMPDVVVIDIGLPDRDGYEVAYELRSIATVTRPLLIAATGYGLRSFRALADNLVFDHYLLKPTSAATLRALIEHAMKVRARTQGDLAASARSRG
ncbi:MAG: hybrid sensor histidine kinase/response regulator [Steroidobacter sp.]